MSKAGVKVGLGVDGSASNDGSHLFAEVRQTMLLARLRAGLLGASRSAEDAPPLMTARQALELGTLGGASVLGRSGDIGSLEMGKCADFISFDMNKLEYAGAGHDPLAALVFCAPRNVDTSFVHGKMVVKNGQLLTVNQEELIKKHNRASKRLVYGE